MDRQGWIQKLPYSAMNNEYHRDSQFARMLARHSFEGNRADLGNIPIENQSRLEIQGPYMETVTRTSC